MTLRKFDSVNSELKVVSVISGAAWAKPKLHRSATIRSMLGISFTVTVKQKKGAKADTYPSLQTAFLDFAQYLQERTMQYPVQY